MMDFISRPFGVLMEFIYNNLAFHNYGVAIIIFTFFMKLLLLPLNVKQQRSMERQQALAPEIEALQQKYKDDRKKFQEEQMNLYTKYNISPYSGCLPMLLQFPLILIIYQIIRRPLTYIAGMSATVIQKLAEAFNGTNAGEAFVKNWSNNEITINSHFMERIEDFKAIAGDSELINMKFLGIFDLGITPNWKVWEFGDQWRVYVPLLFIPILAVATSYLQMWVTNLINNSGKKKDDSKNPMSGGMNSIIKLMPLMTLFFGFMLPSGLGLYWTVSNLFSILQTFLIKKLFNIKKKEGSV